MKGLPFLVLFLTCFAGAAGALDWGLLVDNATGVRYESEAELMQRARAALWLRRDLSDKLAFAAQGSYVYDLDRPYLFDLDYLFLRGRFAGPDSAFSFTAGRFVLSEFSGTVFSHTADGFRLGWDNPALSFELGAAYTGLLLKPVSTIEVSSADAADRGIRDRVFAPPRALVSLALGFPEVFLRQDLDLALLGQYDLRDPAQFEMGEGLVHGAYLGLGLGGPLGHGFHWNILGWLSRGLMNDEVPMFGFLAGAGLRWYAPALLSSRLSLRGLYASGDREALTPYSYSAGDGVAMTFLPISAASLGLVFSPRLSNLIVAEAAYSLKPLAFLQAEIKGLAFFRATPGGISEGGLDPADTDSLYLGSEVGARLNGRPFSDVGFSIGYGLFLPAAGTVGAFLDDTPRHRAVFELSVSL